MMATPLMDTAFLILAASEVDQSEACKITYEDGRATLRLLHDVPSLGRRRGELLVPTDARGARVQAHGRHVAPLEHAGWIVVDDLRSE